MKSKIATVVFAMVFLLTACGEGEGCKDLSWESDGYTADSQFSAKASAGEKCENYNDYWDGDLNKIIAQIQSMNRFKQKMLRDAIHRQRSYRS